MPCDVISCARNDLQYLLVCFSVSVFTIVIYEMDVLHVLHRNVRCIVHGIAKQNTPQYIIIHDDSRSTTPFSCPPSQAVSSVPARLPGTGHLFLRHSCPPAHHSPLHHCGSSPGPGLGSGFGPSVSASSHEWATLRCSSSRSRQWATRAAGGSSSQGPQAAAVPAPATHALIPTPWGKYCALGLMFLCATINYTLLQVRCRSARLAMYSCSTVFMQQSRQLDN